MFGGLKKSASRLALVAAAGALATTANAADLGGDCCADLEERVAELEATTARKGNRKVSLTISGQVNRAVMYWNDGASSNTYFGLDNTNSSSRFGFSGSAKITPSVSAGFSLLIDVANAARTFTVTQGNEDSDAARTGDHGLRLRDANWWIESSSIGRLTVGRMTAAGITGSIDLGGVGVGGIGSFPSGVGGALIFRDKAANAFTPSTVGNVTDAAQFGPGRGEGVRYNSPTFAGFTFAASIMEAANVQTDNGSTNGQALGADLKYAGEFSGIRLAAAVGWESFKGQDSFVGATSLPSANHTDVNAALSLMHVSTGLFVQGDWSTHSFTLNSNPALAVANGTKRDGNRWLVQAGIGQNWFGIGKTTVYGEYGRYNNMQFARFAGATAALVGATDGDRVSYWGIGVNQTIDAAAMDLYANYRNFSASGVLTGTAAAPLDTGASVHDISIFMAGARIRF